MMDWTSSDIQKSVQDVLVHDKHNSLCLAHGRKPIIPVRGCVDYEKLRFFKTLSIILSVL